MIELMLAVTMIGILAVQSYFIGADPLTTGTGQGVRHFATSSSGTTYESSKRIAAFQKGVPPKPAKAIQ